MATVLGEGLPGVLERATFLINTTAGEEFGAAVERASALISSSPGFLGMSLLAGIEREDVYLLLVNWESVAAHEAFRASPAFPSWREVISPYFAAPPEVEHFEEVFAKKS